jgi:flagellar motor component MotA
MDFERSKNQKIAEEELHSQIKNAFSTWKSKLCKPLLQTLQEIMNECRKEYQKEVESFNDIMKTTFPYIPFEKQPNEQLRSIDYCK